MLKIIYFKLYFKPLQRFYLTLDCQKSFCLAACRFFEPKWQQISLSVSRSVIVQSLPAKQTTYKAQLTSWIRRLIVISDQLIDQCSSASVAPSCSPIESVCQHISGPRQSTVLVKVCYKPDAIFSLVKATIVIALKQFISWTETKNQLNQSLLAKCIKSADPRQAIVSIMYESVDVIYIKKRSRANCHIKRRSRFEAQTEVQLVCALFFQFNWRLKSPVEDQLENQSRTSSPDQSQSSSQQRIKPSVELISCQVISRAKRQKAFRTSSQSRAVKDNTDQQLLFNVHFHESYCTASPRL